MRWWGNGSISEISVAKAGLNRCPYVSRSPSTTTRTTSGSAVKSMEGATTGRLTYATLDSETFPVVEGFFFAIHTPSARRGELSAPYSLCVPIHDGVDAPYQIVEEMSSFLSLPYFGCTGWPRNLHVTAE